MLAGPLDRDPDFVEQLQARITRLGYGHRVRLTGVLTGAALSHAYTTADLLVAPSRSETYGMTVTEALAHGLPVIAAAVGGLPEALGSTADGTRPGQLVLPAIRLPSPPRSETGWATSATDTGYGPPHDSGGRPCAAGNRPRKR